MTKAILTKYINLVDQLRKAEAAYNDYACLACPGSQNYDGMPRPPGGVSRKTEDFGISLAKYAEMIGIHRIKRVVATLTPDVEEFIAGIQDVETKKVLMYRVLEAMPFKEVAAKCGPGVSAAAVIMRYARAIKDLPEC